MMEKILEAAAAHWAKVVLLLLAVLGLTLVYRIIRSAMPTEMVQEIQAIRTRMEQEGRAAEEEAFTATGESAKMKADIRDMVTKSPGGGGLILNRWMGGK